MARKTLGGKGASRCLSFTAVPQLVSLPDVFPDDSHTLRFIYQRAP